MTLAYAAEAPPTDAASFSALEIMFHASPVVQLTLLILIGLSVMTWAVIFFKWGTIKRCATSTDDFLETFWSGKSMDHIYTEAKKFSGSAVAKVFQSGYVELQRLMERERQRKPEGGTAADLLRTPPESSITNLERAVSRASRSELMRLERSF
ncbi:hypothetical protein K2X33_01860 [bacterium]|nr:hypothetical protein [bacterium]